MPKRAQFVSCLILVLGTLAAQPAAAQSTRKDLTTLASERFAGREVGTPEHDLARDFIVERMKEAGLEPAGIDGSWFIPVSVVRRSRPATGTKVRLGDALLSRGVGYQIASFSDAVQFEETPIFVGYGLTTGSWDDYRGVDVRGRVVVAFTSAPKRVLDGLADRDRYLLSEESKAAVALANGAKAIVFVNDPRSHGGRSDQRPDELPSVRPQFPLRGIGAARLSARRATEHFGAAGLDLEQYQESLEASPQAVEVPLTVGATLELEREVVTADNVAGRLPGTTDAPPVVLGAHYDHLGVDGPGSRWNGPEKIHPGADDNASGVAVLLSVARSLASTGPRSRTIVFLATTGEELGLRGARQAAHILRQPSGPGLFVNLDMLGRLRDSTLHAYGLDEGSPFAPIAGRAAGTTKLTLKRHPLYDAASDHVAFAERGWQAIGLSTGRHADYHTPGDTIRGIDWRGLERVEQFVRSLASELASNQDPRP